jgi:dolichol kinase
MRSKTLEESLQRELKATLESAAASLQELADAINQKTSGAQRWRSLYASLARSYDQLTAELSSARELAGVSFKRLTPANYARTTLHILAGLTGALLYHYLLSREDAILVMGLLVVTFTALEVLRRRSAAMNDALMRFAFFRRIARAREYYRVNSSTYYAWGMLAALILFQRQAVEAGCLVLAFGDPAASNLGGKFGRAKILRDKSVIGTLAFFIAAFIAVLSFQLSVYAAQPIASSLLVAGVASSIGASVEALTTKLDDNLTVPLAVSCAIDLVVRNIA